MKVEIEGDFSFNLVVLTSGLTIHDITVPFKYQNVNEQILYNMLNIGYGALLTQKSYYFFKQIPINQKFSRINDFRHIDGEGFLLIGEHLEKERIMNK
jgi:hypothetical protein